MYEVKSEVKDELLLKEIFTSLLQKRKRIPVKYVMMNPPAKFELDSLDDLIFNRQVEYELFNQNIDEIVRLNDEETALIEFGCGDSRLTNLIIERDLGIRSFVAVDPSKEKLEEAVINLKQEYPWMKILSVNEDFARFVSLPDEAVEDYRLFVIPSGKLCKYTMHETKIILKRISCLSGGKGSLIAGIELLERRQDLMHLFRDKHKEFETYNKALLKSIGNLTGGYIDLSVFRYDYIINDDLNRIEVGLECTEDTILTIQNEEIEIKKAEFIITMLFYKYSIDEIKAIASEYFNVNHYWIDEKKHYALMFFTKQ